MAGASNRQRGSYSSQIRHSYVDGNTVRIINPTPERRREEKKEPKRQPRRHYGRRPVHMFGIDGFSFVFMTAALCFVLTVCFSYIYSQNNVRQMKKQIVELQTDIVSQQEKNNIMYNEILSSVDLADVYKKATTKLKMVRAQKNKVYTYKNKKSDMVKQYSDIPTSD